MPRTSAAPLRWTACLLASSSFPLSCGKNPYGTCWEGRLHPIPMSPTGAGLISLVCVTRALVEWIPLTEFARAPSRWWKTSRGGRHDEATKACPPLRESARPNAHSTARRHRLFVRGPHRGAASHLKLRPWRCKRTRMWKDFDRYPALQRKKHIPLNYHDSLPISEKAPTPTAGCTGLGACVWWWRKIKQNAPPPPPPDYSDPKAGRPA